VNSYRPALVRERANSPEYAGNVPYAGDGWLSASPYGEFAASIACGDE
jgi:hypothetical protein